MPALANTIKALAGLAVSLVAAEGIFWLRDDGAFPHLNAYVADDELGARLRPGATTRLQYSGNPRTTIEINSRGYRGEDWPPPTEGEILIVGDSQVFGLGVEADETFSAQLAEITGRTVINAGVPTYGPAECVAVIEELIDERKPETVIFTANMVNDLFEIDRPNRERHAIWDGWAVRLETAPESVIDFPGRTWLYRDSHFFFALRWLWYSQIRPVSGGGFASEGSWTDLVSAGQAAALERANAAQATRDAQRERANAAASAQQRIAAQDSELTEMMLQDMWQNEIPSRIVLDEEAPLRAALAQPGDIVFELGIEASREVRVTAELIRKGAAVRREMEERLRAQGSPEARAALAERDAAWADLQEARSTPLQLSRAWSPLTPTFTALAEIARERGARPAVLLLPVDVQVDEREWAKYGAEPMDMSETLVLNEDALQSARSLGVLAVDALPALAGASPGAFLNADIHMTPSGHRAVAEAMAAALEGPDPLALPAAGLPAGRSPVPVPEAWLQVDENYVKGSSAARCETRQIREWLRVTCLPNGRSKPLAAQVLEDPSGEAMVLATGDATTLVAPVSPGDRLVVRFRWTDRTQELVAERSAEGEPSYAFGPREPAEDAPTPEADRLICERFRDAAGHVGDVDCSELYGAAEPTCLYEGLGTTLVDRPLEEQLVCMRGGLYRPLACAEGEAHFGAAGFCRPLCSDAVPCAAGTGTCREWMGAGMCR